MSHGAGRAGGFGKRGRVELSHSEPAPVAHEADGKSNAVKWLGGGLAACAVMALLAGGTGGGGLLGGILGGLIGKHLADRSATNAAAKATAAGATAAAAQSTTVNRGGFGSTGTSSGFFSGS